MILAIVCGAIGAVGAALHVRASLKKGKWVGTRHEFEFVLGSALALIFISLAIVLASS